MIDSPLTETQRDLVLLGKCPYCQRSIKAWKAPMGSFAPEAWATLREHGVNPGNGHMQACTHQDIRL
jgi:hypothetical protein